MSTHINATVMIDSHARYDYQFLDPVGQVRFHLGTRMLEVYDGTQWTRLNFNVILSPNHVFEDEIQWIKKKRAEESYLIEKAKSNTAIRDLLQQKQDIEEKLKMVDILTRENNSGTT